MSFAATTSVALILLGLAVLAGMAAFGAVSIHERERRAAVIAFPLALVASLPFFVAATLPAQVRTGLLAALAGAAVVGLVLWFAPVGRVAVGNGRPSRRVDERDIMFARARLQPGSREFESYYAMRPENREPDDETRALPGLLSHRATKAEPVAFATSKASFDMTHALRDEVDGPVARHRDERPASELTEIVKRQALHLGARDVGVTELLPHHVYTHVGRGSGKWGDEIPVEHRWAVAFTMEMDFHAMRCAPEAPVVAESARQYVEGAKIAIQIASMIRRLGYPARAHIDGNYRVIAPLVAKDAGIGEIGRMGILMTPSLGPRVRLGVVTTDLPLIADSPTDDRSVIDFCTVCKKCAENCPSQSIPLDDRTRIDEGWRWAIDPDTCFRYWNAVGTDCGVCMTVCPYAHPDNAAHDIVRWAIRRSGTARRGALWMDDLFYGRRFL